MVKMFSKVKYKQKYIGLLLAIVSLFSLPCFASESDFIDWHSTNIQLLRGSHYQLGDDSRTVMTVEYANSWRYGDFYIFGDQVWPDSGSSTYYYEPTLRFSLKKMLNTDYSDGLVKDVLLAVNVEKPKGQSGRRLLGLAVDLNMKGFRFFKTMLFSRNNPDLAGDTYQLTVAWNYPFKIQGVSFLAEGFTDLAGSEGVTVANQLLVPRLLMNVTDVFGLTESTLWAGIEWQYWHNKFGVDGVTESVPQLQVKYVF